MAISITTSDNRKGTKEGSSNNKSSLYQLRKVSGILGKPSSTPYAIGFSGPTRIKIQAGIKANRKLATSPYIRSIQTYKEGLE